jgi:hypothetical protein
MSLPVGIRVRHHAGYPRLTVNYLETGLDPERVGNVEEKTGLVAVLENSKIFMNPKIPFEMLDSMSSQL